MLASQLFPVCRERFRRTKNPLVENENVSFIVLPGKQALPTTSSAGFWYQNSPNQGAEPESFIVGPRGTGNDARWTYNQTSPFTYWRRMWASSAGQGGKDSMILPYQHRNKTGELYVRCVFEIRPGPTDALNSMPIFSIHDILKGELELSIWCTRQAGAISFAANYHDNNDEEQIIYSEPIPNVVNGKVSYVYDLRLGLHGIDPQGEPYLQITRPEFNAQFTTRLNGYPGSGYRDAPGVKNVVWCSATMNGLIPAGDIRPSRLGIGNLIKQALP